jgi:hypothetical protein
VCQNDCVAFVGELAGATECPNCHVPRQHPKLGPKRLHETFIVSGLAPLPPALRGATHALGSSLYISPYTLPVHLRAKHLEHIEAD